VMTDNAEALKIEAEGLMAHDKPGTEVARDLALGDGESVPMAMAVASRQSSAGYTIVYDTQTGAPSTVNNNMLRHQLLSKKRQTRDGKLVPAFTTIKPDPATLPKRQYHKCLLHPEHADYAEVAEYGFEPCYKANLTSRQVVLTHMERRHPQEWATVKEARDRAERDEVRAERRALLELAATSRAGSVPATTRKSKTVAGDDDQTAA
jgi:hypothetical protein